MHDPVFNWRLRWNGVRETWSTAGEFILKREAEAAQKQLARRNPQAEFKLEFIGKGIAHINEGAKYNVKF